MPQWWSWLLTAIGVSGLYVAGKKSPWGWAIGIAAQLLWLTYAIVTRQWGFLVSSFAYGFVYLKNFRSWRHQENTIQGVELMVSEKREQQGLLGAEAYGRKPTKGEFQRKTTSIRAIQFTGDNFIEILEFFEVEDERAVQGIYGPTDKNPNHLILTTMHDGDKAPCRIGDWVLPDALPGTFYSCAEEVFAATYDYVKE